MTGDLRDELARAVMRWWNETTPNPRKATEPSEDDWDQADALLPVVEARIAEAVAAERERIVRAIEAQQRQSEYANLADWNTALTSAARIARAAPTGEAGA